MRELKIERDIDYAAHRKNKDRLSLRYPELFFVSSFKGDRFKQIVTLRYEHIWNINRVIDNE